MIVRFFGRLVARLFLTVFAVAILVFFLLLLVPGDAVDAAIGQASASEAVREQIRVDLGLDQPLSVRFVRYVVNLLTVDFGTSWVSRQSVHVLLAQNLGATLSLAGSSLVLALFFGLALGAGSRMSGLSQLSEILAVLMFSAPVLVVGLLLIWIFSVFWNVLPSSGNQGLASLVLPALTIAIPSGGVIGRVLQTEMRTNVAQRMEFLSAARGVQRIRRIFFYLLPTAWGGVSEIVGLQAAFLVGGTVITETLFTRAGVGRLLVTAVLNKDVPVVQASVVTIAATYVIILELLALTRYALDPRLS